MFKVCAFLHEARGLFGIDIDPHAEIKIHQNFDLSKSSSKTSTTEKTNNPIWSYSFSTSKSNITMEEFLDAIVEIAVYSGIA